SDELHVRLPIIITEFALNYRFAPKYGSCVKFKDPETGKDNCSWQPEKVHTTLSPRYRREQKAYFYRLLKAFLSRPKHWKGSWNCDEVIFWGFDDTANEPDSAVSFALDRFGLLFDPDGCVRVEDGTALGRKPAYFGVLEALIETYS